MPAELKAELDGKVLQIHFTGKLQKEDYDQLVPQVQRAVELQKKVRMLVDMHDFHGWAMGAAWEDFKFGIQHYSHIDRLAVVGEKTWQKWAAYFCKPFTKAEVRYFDHAESEQAQSWLHDGLPMANAGNAL